MMARRPLHVGSTFSGVGGADLGLECAGFQLAWTCEWDEWKRSVLAAHWPDVQHYGDIRELTDPKAVDLLCGGFPCQDLSVAGKRRGFDGERSVLAFEFLRLAESIQPRWLLMENVPGLLSSNGGRDLARLLDELGAIGYGWAYRVLDARYFGVPQRRRRIFICAYRAQADIDSGIAAERALRAIWEGSGGDSTPGWPPRALTTGSVGTGTHSGGRIVGALSAQGYQRYTDQELVGQGQLVTHEDVPDVAGTITRRHHKGTNSTVDDGALVVTQSIAGTVCTQMQDGQNMTYVVKDPVADIASTLQASGKSGGHRIDAEGAAGGHLIPNQMSVRRLTPVECERLMGWPDNWTAPPGVKAPDTKRYAACGDGIVSWVAYWIGCRIQMIEDETA